MIKTFGKLLRGSADPDLGVGKESVRRQVEILRRRTLTDAAGCIVLRAVAWAEPAVVLALMRERDAAEMGADADHHQPLVVARLHALIVGFRVGQARYVDRARLVDLFLGAVEDEDRLRAPENLDDLPVGDGRKIDLDRGACGDGRGVRIHLRDQRHQARCGADRADRGGGDIEKIAARVCRRRHGRHVWALSPGWLYVSAHGWMPKGLLGSRGGGADRLRQSCQRQNNASVRSIGTLAVSVQARYRAKDQESHKSFVQAVRTSRIFVISR